VFVSRVYAGVRTVGVAHNSDETVETRAGRVNNASAAPPRVGLGPAARNARRSLHHKQPGIRRSPGGQALDGGGLCWHLRWRPVGTMSLAKAPLAA